MRDLKQDADYFAFGAPMKGRNFTSSKYRYGFNGKENDSEANGTGNGTQDYGMRIYNPQLGRFLSVDPLAAKFPWWSPYQFAGNIPIKYVDLDGLEIGYPGYNSYRAALQISSSDPKTAMQAEKDKDKWLADHFGFAPAIGLAAPIIFEGYASSALLQRMFISGGVGSTVSMTFSWAKGESGYNILKSGVSGFFAGAMLGLSPTSITSLSSAAKVLGIGSLSGVVGEATKETFDNVYGNGTGYDLKKIMLSGGVGSVANLVSVGSIQMFESKINEQVAAQLATTETTAYRKVIQDAIKEETPRIGSRQLKMAVNDRIVENREAIKKSGEILKKGISVAIERGVDYLQENGTGAGNK